MQKRFVLRTSIIAASLLATHVQAFQLGKPIKTSVVITNQKALATDKAKRKDVVVMNVSLTQKERDILMSYQPKHTKLATANKNLPSVVNLGMNHVPVLDQGLHGSCVTFAMTAAIDAVIGRGDYVSQLCNLELGAGLEKTSYLPSGWDGSFGPWVLDQIMRFGIVNKENQQTKGCAGVTDYPTMDMFSEGKPMSIDEFNAISEALNYKLYPVTKMSFFQRLDTHFADTDKAELALSQVKESLSNGNRVVFGTFLVLSPYCSAGACATYHQSQDTWALTKEIELPPYQTGGHEMVITGYDDNAIATDQEGNQYQGLLTLRNSWGEEVGDNGNYYMTYDYFKKFVGEVDEIAEMKG